MDLGGDSSRFYFYDPIHYLNQSLYSISYGAFGLENTTFYASIPLFLVLSFLKFILQSSTVLITSFHGFTLSVAFLACYLIIKDLLQQEVDKGRFGKNIIEASAILAGVFYNFSPVPILNWDHVLLISNVVFLNPLMFFLLLRFFLSGNMTYVLGMLLISFIFAPNFSFAGAPPFFSFYPIVIPFLILYTKFVANKPIPVKKIVVSAVLFFLIQAFQLAPQIEGLLMPGNVINTAVFSQQAIVDRGLGYFTAVAPSIKTSLNLLTLPQMTKLNWYAFFFIVFPLILVLGFIWNKKKGYLLSGVFFLIVLFFASANITKVGFTLYIALFQIPGFSMFRNFYGQWFRSYDFFYMLLFGQAMAIVLSKLDKQFHRYFLVSLIFILLLITSWPMINGVLVNTDLWQSKNIKSHIEMDPQYEKVLEFIRALPVDGRFISLPMSDYSYQILQGKNGGAYMGPSTITYLTQKGEFIGPGDFGSFNSAFLTAVRDKNYLAVKNMLAIFNVKYIFYNSDPYIYGDNFPAFPYDNVRKYFPATQEEYQAFIKDLDLEKIVDFGDKYHIYALKDSDYLPHIYAAKKSYYADQLAEETLLPLFFDLPERRIVLYDKNMDFQNTDGYDKIFLKAINKSLYVDAAKKKNFQPIDNQGIAERLFPPLRILIGQNLGNKSNQIDDAFIDNAKKKAVKIIDNLRNNGEQLSVLVDPAVITNLNQEPNDLNKIFSTTVVIDGSWNLELFHYTTEMADLIDKIKKPNNSIYPLMTNKESINYALNVDEINLSRIIASLPSKTNQDKMFLGLLGNKIFDYLKKQLDFNLPADLAINYSIDIPEDGIYEVYRYKDQLDDLKEATQSSLSIDNKILSVNKLQSEQSWLRFNNFYTRVTKDLTILIHLFSNNLIKDEAWQSIDGHIINYNNATFLLNSVLGDNQGLFRQITPFRPNTLYVISFDYNTLGKNFWIVLYELGGKEHNHANLAKSESLRSYDWKTYKRVIQSGEDPNIIFLIQIMLRDQCLSNCPIDKVEIKNLSVIELPPEQGIFLKKNNASDSQERILPQITFTKINPTKYQIKIRNATNPYTLVFQGAYNKEWKLFHVSGEMSKDEKTIQASYFKGEVKEGNHTSTFLSHQTFDTWGKQVIADKNHFLINGYANAWYVEPKDVNGITDYTLILEFNTQRIFYGFLLISFITFIGCIVFLLNLVIRRYRVKIRRMR